MFLSELDTHRFPVGVHAYDGELDLDAPFVKPLIRAGVRNWKKLSGKMRLAATSEGIRKVKEAGIISLYDEIAILPGRSQKKAIKEHFPEAVQFEALAAASEPVMLMRFDAVVWEHFWEKGSGAIMPLHESPIEHRHIPFAQRMNSLWSKVHKAPYLCDILKPLLISGVKAPLFNTAVCYHPDPAFARMFGDLMLRYMERHVQDAVAPPHGFEGTYAASMTLGKIAEGAGLSVVPATTMEQMSPTFLETMAFVLGPVPSCDIPITPQELEARLMKRDINGIHQALLL